MNAMTQKKKKKRLNLPTSEKLRFQIHTIKVIDSLIVVGLNLSLHKRIVSVKFMCSGCPAVSAPQRRMAEKAKTNTVCHKGREKTYSK